MKYGDEFKDESRGMELFFYRNFLLNLDLKRVIVVFSFLDNFGFYVFFFRCKVVL